MSKSMLFFRIFIIVVLTVVLGASDNSTDSSSTRNTTNQVVLTQGTSVPYKVVVHDGKNLLLNPTDILSVGVI